MRMFRFIQDKSGAYLFLPDGPAKPLRAQSPLIRIIKGRILTDVHVFLDKVFHVVRIKNVPGVDGMAVEVRWSGTRFNGAIAADVMSWFLPA